MNESALTRAVINQLNHVPLVYATKVHGSPYQRKGLPDIVGCYEGAFFGIEMKLTDNKPTQAQLSVLEKLRRAGALTGVVTAEGNAAGVRDAFRQCLEIIGYEQR